MIRRSSRILLKVLAALFTGVVIVGGLAAWRLSGDEAVRLGFLTPYIERALTAPDGTFSVRIDQTRVVWAGWARNLDLRATDVQAIGADGQVIAVVPEVSVSLSLRRLLRGQVAPTAIDLFGPRLYLTREPDGRFRFGPPDMADGELPAGGASSMLPALLAEILAPPDRDRPTGLLRSARITDGVLIYSDRRLGLTRRAPDADIGIRRTIDGLAGDLTLTLDQGGVPARLRADLSYTRTTDQIAVSAWFADLAAAGLADLDPGLAALAESELLIEGAMTTTIGLDGRMGDAEFDLAAGPGLLALPGRPDERLRVRHLTIDGRLDAGGDRLTVDEAVLQLDGPRLSATGTVTGVASRAAPEAASLAVSGRVTAADIPTAMVHRYWPEHAARGARNWVAENIEGGLVEHAEADIALRFPGGDRDEPVIERLSGAFSTVGLTVHYLRPMPPLRDVAGIASFNDREFVADLHGGGVDGLSIEQGRVRIADLRQRREIIEIEGRVHGSLPDTLRLLDHPRLGYPSRIGLAPADTGGDVSADLSFRFPAIRGLSFDAVEIGVDAEVARAELRAAMFDRDVSQGSFGVAVSSELMTVDGAALIGGIPADLHWVENFSGEPFRSRIALSGTTDGDQRASLGLDVRPHLHGPVPTKLLITRFGEGRTLLAASFDLDSATIDLPAVGWSKPPGEPGSAELVIELDGDRAAAIPRLAVAAGTLAVEGRGRFGEAGEMLRSVTLDSLTLGDSALEDVSIDFSGDRPDVRIGGGRLDAEPLLRDAGAAGEATEGMAFALRADRLAEVRFGPGRSVTDVAMSLRHDGTVWERILVEGMLPGAHPMSLRYEPAEPNRHRLTVTADDAGAALRTFDILDNVQGGRLRIVAVAEDDEPQRPLRGRMEISRFRVVDAPFLARLLMASTLPGFVDLLRGDGILFSRFIGDFTKTGGALDIPLARAYGPSIGLTAMGALDLETDSVDLEGTIVPAYVLNNMLANIPVVGDILQGGKGEGVFAATYRASGSLADPRITVNPLAALAPGFLRGLFDILDGGSGEPPEPRALPERGANR